MTDQTAPGNVPLSDPLGPLYAKRDHEAQGEHYMRHIMAMTAEGLHAKSAIAGELAHRDIEIAGLRRQLAAALGARADAEEQERSEVLRNALLKCKTCALPSEVRFLVNAALRA